MDELIPLPAKTDWSGAWIWVPESTGYSWRNSYAFFRKRLSVSGPVCMNIAADTRYEAWVDGRRIGRGTAPSVAAYKAFDTYNLEFEPGEHVLCVVVHHIGEVCATAEESRFAVYGRISPLQGFAAT